MLFRSLRIIVVCRTPRRAKFAAAETERDSYDQSDPCRKDLLAFSDDVYGLCGGALGPAARRGQQDPLADLAVPDLALCDHLGLFQVQYTPDVLHGLLLALAAAVLLHVGIIVVVNLLGHPLHLDAVEKASMIYSNAGNLIIPIVTAVLGKEWVIYSSAFLSVQLFLLWSHAKSMLCGEKSFELKKVLTNINMIAILTGAALFLLHIQLPAIIEDSLDMVGSAIGPISMIILGMLMAGMNFKKILGYRRLWLVTALRLVGIPLAAVALLKLSGLAHLVPDGQTILLVSLLATCTPSASTITQMAQIYGKDADYASAINVVTTLLCIFTMPLMVALYQL